MGTRSKLIGKHRVTDRGLRHDETLARLMTVADSDRYSHQERNEARGELRQQVRRIKSIPEADRTNTQTKVYDAEFALTLTFGRSLRELLAGRWNYRRLKQGTV